MFRPDLILKSMYSMFIDELVGADIKVKFLGCPIKTYYQKKFDFTTVYKISPIKPLS